MFRRVVNFLSVGMLLASPVTAQFGVGGNRKKSSSFQELNEQAKQMQEGGDGAGGFDLADFAGLDPKALEEMVSLGAQYEQVMKMLTEMSPEELENQMKDALNMLNSGEMMENMLKNQDEILKTLEEMGQVDAEELEKFKKDPEYFEQKMKESFGQMKDLFSDPEVIKAATKSMQGISELYNNPEILGNMMEKLLEDFNDDEKIEEVRQMLLNDPGALAGAFDNEEMKEVLNDPVKWRETVREGQGLLNQAGAEAVGAGGAGVGEL